MGDCDSTIGRHCDEMGPSGALHVGNTFPIVAWDSSLLDKAEGLGRVSELSCSAQSLQVYIRAHDFVLQSKIGSGSFCQRFAGFGVAFVINAQLPVQWFRPTVTFLTLVCYICRVHFKHIVRIYATFYIFTNEKKINLHQIWFAISQQTIKHDFGRINTTRVLIPKTYSYSLR